MSFVGCVGECLVFWNTLWTALSDLAKRDGAGADDPHLWGIRVAAAFDEQALLRLLKRDRVPESLADCRRATSVDGIGVEGQAAFLSLCGKGAPARACPHRAGIRVILVDEGKRSSADFDDLWGALVYIGEDFEPLCYDVGHWVVSEDHDSLEEDGFQRPEKHPDMAVQYLFMHVWSSESWSVCEVFGLEKPEEFMQLVVDRSLHALVDRIQTPEQEQAFISLINKVLRYSFDDSYMLCEMKPRE